MSSGVLRSCRRSKWHASRSPTLTCAGLISPAQTDDPSPTSEPPGAMHALSCLGSNATFVPNARSRTASEEQSLFGAFRTSLRSRARPKLPHLVRPGDRLHSGPSRAPYAVAVASELRRTHGLDACPRLARGMFRRLQQSTISVFKDEYPRPASRFDFARAVRSSAWSKKASIHDEAPASVRRWRFSRVLAE